MRKWAYAMFLATNSVRHRAEAAVFKRMGSAWLHEFAIGLSDAEQRAAFRTLDSI